MYAPIARQRKSCTHVVVARCLYSAWVLYFQWLIRHIIRGRLAAKTVGCLHYSNITLNSSCSQKQRSVPKDKLLKGGIAQKIEFPTKIEGKKVTNYICLSCAHPQCSAGCGQTKAKGYTPRDKDLGTPWYHLIQTKKNKSKPKHTL